MGRNRGAYLTIAALVILGLSGCGASSDEKRFAASEQLLLSMGKMRGEIKPADAPYDNRMLAENFRRIALYETQLDKGTVPKPITRWAGPLRFAIEGRDVTARDLRTLRYLMQRASALTQLEVTYERSTPNFVVYILEDGEDFGLLPRNGDTTVPRADLEGLSAYALDCSVHAYTDSARPSEIRAAIVFIRAAVKGYYRQACLHEEVFQGLGLFNDDDTVRPSIFNDDEEFALLTEHDEYLVRVLYDHRLASGMTADQAMPLVPGIIASLRHN